MPHEQGQAGAAAQPAPGTRHVLWDLALLFLRLGVTGFGGPAAHIALMQDEVVRRRGWLTQQEFLDLVGATNLIPGPNSTELAIHIGHRRAGWPGLLVAGLGFICPAMIIVMAVAAAYLRLGRLPSITSALYGIKPVMVAIVAYAVFGLARTAIKHAWHAVVAALALTAAFLAVDQLLILGLGALLVAGPRLARGRHAGTGGTAVGLAPLVPGLALTSSVVAAATPTSMAVFLVFLKIGSVLFGSGYVLLAFLRSEFVLDRQWLTEAQLLDAIAVGQVTPGPVFTTATFIGYLLQGAAGGLAATAGIFLPAFVFVALSGPLVPRLRRSPLAGALLDGVNIASLALMAAVSWQLGRAALVDGVAVLLAGASALLLLWRRLNPAWLLLAGALIGVAVRARVPG